MKPIILFAVSLMLCVGGCVSCNVAMYRVERDTDAVMDRAQVAADRDDMLGYMRQYKANLESRGMTKGHTALIFTKPNNDLALHYRAVQMIIGRLESVGSIEPNTVEYQTALNDIRGVLNDLEYPADGWVWVQYWWLICASVLFGIAALVAFFWIAEP